MPAHQVRIIGGKWRGRKLLLPRGSFIRPTMDKTRTTLFNWLSPCLTGANCLDLFAGSGALGFEALSRGAKQVTFVDIDRRVIEQLRKNQQKLGAENVDVVHEEAAHYLKRISTSFDVVFLDPPFYQGLIQPCGQLLYQRKLLQPGAWLYIESEALQKTDLPSASFWGLPDDFEIKRYKREGQLAYYLIKCP